jgi:hypothetical protein
MKTIDRAHRWISVDHVLDRTRVEIRIHCDDPYADIPALLDANEARALAHALLEMADELAGARTCEPRPSSSG